MPSPLSFRLEVKQVLNTLLGILLEIRQRLLDGAFNNNSMLRLSLHSLLYMVFFFRQNVTLRI